MKTAFLSSLRTNLQISTVPEDSLYSPSPYMSLANPSETSLGSDLDRFSQARRSSSLAYIDPDEKTTTAYAGSLTYNASQTPRTHNPHAHSSPAASSSNSAPTITTNIPSLPPLTIRSASSEQEITAALDLIGDSVVQQRQMAARYILFHPKVLATTLFIFLSSIKLLYTGSPSDMVLMLAVWTTCSVAGLLALRHLTKGYIPIIHRTSDRPWLSENSVHGLSHRRDEILVARHNGTDEIVGVLVMRIAKTVTEAGTPGTLTRSSRRKSSARWTGIIRAWTVKRSLRFQGVGTRLLEEAIANCRLRTLDGPIFAEDHANSKRVLPGMFNAEFDKRESWARGFLEHAIIAQRNK